MIPRHVWQVGAIQLEQCKLLEHMCTSKARKFGCKLCPLEYVTQSTWSVSLTSALPRQNAPPFQDLSLANHSPLASSLLEERGSSSIEFCPWLIAAYWWLQLPHQAGECSHSENHKGMPLSKRFACTLNYGVLEAES